MDSKISMMSGAIDADEYPIRNRCPSRVLSLAVEARLWRGEAEANRSEEKLLELRVLSDDWREGERELNGGITLFASWLRSFLNTRSKSFLSTMFSPIILYNMLITIPWAEERDLYQLL